MIVVYCTEKDVQQKSDDGGQLATPSKNCGGIVVLF